MIDQILKRSWIVWLPYYMVLGGLANGFLKAYTLNVPWVANVLFNIVVMAVVTVTLKNLEIGLLSTNKKWQRVIYWFSLLSDCRVGFVFALIYVSIYLIFWFW